MGRRDSWLESIKNASEQLLNKVTDVLESSTEKQDEQPDWSRQRQDPILTSQPASPVRISVSSLAKPQSGALPLVQLPRDMPKKRLKLAASQPASPNEGLPTIELADLKHNLIRLQRYLPPKPVAPKHSKPLQVIDSQEIRMRLREKRPMVNPILPVGCSSLTEKVLRKKTASPKPKLESLEGKQPAQAKDGLLVSQPKENALKQAINDALSMCANPAKLQEKIAVDAALLSDSTPQNNAVQMAISPLSFPVQGQRLSKIYYRFQYAYPSFMSRNDERTSEPLMSSPEAAAPVVTQAATASSSEEKSSFWVPETVDSKKHLPLTLPTLALLREAEPDAVSQTEEELLEGGILIEEKLAEFKVKVSVVDAYAGPVITRYEIEPATGVRGSQIVNLVKDLARTLGVSTIRVVETIPGKTCMGLELPNPKRSMICLSSILASEPFVQSASPLTLTLGKDITGQPCVMDLAKAPHLLVAGTTGSGKSVGVNAMILSMLYKATPEEVRFIMIDPKMLELSVYNDIPHLLTPVVTDMKLAAHALNWCIGEMERRYRLMSALGVRNLAGYNHKIREAEQQNRILFSPFDNKDEPEHLTCLPSIVVIVDEFADLMMVAGKKVEELIARLAQKARAAGIHLILATQRPSVDVITGLIKANIPTRISFQVSSKVDSRTILDQMGAEALLGQGDMLFLPPGTAYPQRVHGAFVSDGEVHAVVEWLKQFGMPDYVEALCQEEMEQEDDDNQSGLIEQSDPLYDEAVALVLRTRKASISYVQRNFRIGYNRAARLMDEMERSGVVSPMESNGNRTVLAPGQTE